MDDRPVQLADGSLSALRALAGFLLALSLTVLIVAVLLPNYALAWLRSEYWLFGQPLNWLEMRSPRIDLTHVILFAWISLLLSCMWARARWWRIALPLLGLAVATELLQFLVPGRSPLVSDLYDDLLGVGIGLATAIPVKWGARRWRMS